MPESTDHERLCRLEDEREILRTLYAYAHGIDYGDEDEFADCWLEDACLEWPGHDLYAGRPAIVGVFRAHTHAPAAYHKHLVLQPQIRLDGPTANVSSYYVRLDGRPTGPEIRSFGRYLDVLDRCPDGRWRFRERRAENESRLMGSRSSVDGV